MPIHYSRIHFVIAWIVSFFSSYMLLGQSVVDNSGVKGTVFDQFGALPGAVVYVKETGEQTKSNLDGSFILPHQSGNFTLQIEYTLYSSFEKEINIKPNEFLDFEIILKPVSTDEQTIKLGSRSTPKSLLETIAPVDVIYPDDIENAFRMELGQLIHFIIPSFNSTHQTISDGTDHVDPATLRGLGPDQLLVLVNGKRRHSSSLINVNGTIGRGSVGTDFNTIPVAAVERIEILRDGASSQYGSDAISGVVNIILKGQTEHVILDSQALVNLEGDGESIYTATNIGFNLGNKGYVNITAEYRDRGATNRAGNYNGNVFGANDTENELNDFFKQTGFDDRRVMEVGNAATRNVALQFNSSYKISEQSTLYAFGGRNFREGKAHAFYRFPNQRNRVVSELFEFGFSPEISTNIQDDAFTIGIKGQQNEWDIDFSHTIGENVFDYTVNNSNNASLGSISPKTFYAGGFIYKHNVTNLDFSRAINFLKGSNLAFGAELRVENYQIVAGEEASYINGGDTFLEDGIMKSRDIGAQGFPGFKPVNELNKFRTNTSGYIEFESNISEKLLTVIGGRYETFSKFGSQATWKTSLRYKPTDKSTLRTSFSTGFRAPSLHQFYFNNTSTQFSTDGAFRIGTFNNSSAPAESLGIERLRPELSSHCSLGFTINLIKSLNLVVDSYFINIKDRIVLSNPIDEGFEALLEPFDLDRAQFFTNAIDTQTIGLDFMLNYSQSIGPGKLNSSLSANISNTKIIGAPRVSDQIKQQGQEIFNRSERSRIEKGQPNFKVNFSNTYEIKALTFILNNNLFGPVTHLNPNDDDPENWVLNDFTGNIESRDQKFSPKLVTDIAIKFKLNNALKLFIGANNAFNVYPDKQKHSDNVGRGNFIYNRRLQQFGVKGANYFARLVLNL